MVRAMEGVKGAGGCLVDGIGGGLCKYLGW
jgi:hypothetical protein